jgi:hypothetical protein
VKHVLWAAAIAASAASQAAVHTHQSGITQIEINGAIVEEAQDAKNDGDVSVSAIHGTLTTPEVRSAARSRFSSGEMAANVRIDSKTQFGGGQVFTLSQATYALQVDQSPVATRAALDFFLPPSFMEATMNAEVPFDTMSLVLMADLRVCFSTSCSSADSQFTFQANLDAGWNGFSLATQVSAAPGVDVTPLENPTVTDVGGPGAGFLRTTTVDYAAFEGHLDLGTVVAGVPVRVEYLMQVRADGSFLDTIGLAAINDPFLLDTDPVQPGAALTLALAPVPEPAGAALLGLGLAALAVRRARASCS